jgi:hypothetical protein
MTRNPAGYASLRRYVVPSSLALLSGPTTGTVVLPKRLDWGPEREFDLSDKRDVAVMYETVLREARREADLQDHLDAALLQELWPTLVLPVPLRAAWQERFPQLQGRAAA